jgi:hypothetical protein
MGGAQSSMGVSRDALLKSSQPMRLIADAALKVMFERITPKDLLDLGNPSTCNKYVLVISGAFDQYFRSIDVMPVIKGKPATIYFQRADILTGTAPGTSDAYKKMRQEVCVLLGYFFKRFFQIYAALALSVFDSENIRQASGVFGLLDSLTARPGLPGPARSVYGNPALAGKVFDPKLQGQYVRGGAGALRDRYQLFEQYINMNSPTELTIKQPQITATLAGPKFIGFPFKNYQDMYFIDYNDKYYVGLKSTFETGVYFMMRIELRTARNTDDLYVVFSEAHKDGKPLTISPSGYNNVRLTLSTRNSEKVKVEEPKSMEGKGVAGAIYTVGKHIYNKVLPGMSSVPAISSGDVIKRENRNRDRDYYDGRRATDYYRGDRGYYRTETGEYGKSDRAPADLAGIVLALEKTRPVAHCVARSLQLLQLDALGPASARMGQSYICNVKFLSPESAADSIPRPGEKLSKSPGLASLETLFQVYENGKVALPERSGEYLGFLQEMEKLFQGKSSGAKTLAGITSQLDGEVCNRILPKGIKDVRGTTIPLAGKGLEAAQRRVKQMWGIHMAHVKEVDKLFAAMFSISGGNQIGVNPKIVAAGLPGLNALAEKARVLLTNYYVGCERSYRDGVGEILGTLPALMQPQQALGPAAAKVAAPPAAPRAAARPVAQRPVVPPEGQPPAK